MNHHPLPASQLIELLGRLAFFGGLSTETLKALAGSARLLSLARGETLYSKGDTATELYVVISGRIKTYLPLSNGSEKVVTIVEGGDSIGAAAVYLGEAHAVHALASKYSHLIAIDRETLLQRAHRDATLACRLMEAVARHKLRLLHDLESCTPHSALERVACYLLQQRPTREAEQYEFILKVNKKELAASINIAQETLSRVFHQLGAAGIIEVRGRLIRVLAGSALADLKHAQCRTGQNLA